MEQALILFRDEVEERAWQHLLDGLSLKKISWEEFDTQVEDPLILSRIATTRDSRSLLHLAVLDNRLDMIKHLKNDLFLKAKRDQYGLSPTDLAKLLDRGEAISLLEKPSTNRVVDYPQIDSFTALVHPVFETQKGLEEVLQAVARAKTEDKIPSEKIWMGIYYDKEIKSHYTPTLQIRHINEEIGFGVFAQKKITPCTFVGEYTGVIQQRSPKELKDKRYVVRYPVWEGKKNYCIDAEHRGNFTRFINHSSKPNLGLQSVYWRGIPRMIFVAIEEIPEGGQLTFDYGDLFWQASKDAPVDDF